MAFEAIPTDVVPLVENEADALRREVIGPYLPREDEPVLGAHQGSLLAARESIPWQAPHAKAAFSNEGGFWLFIDYLTTLRRASSASGSKPGLARISSALEGFMASR